MLLTKTILKS